MKNILHISDLHLSLTDERGFFHGNIKFLLDSLIKDVKKICADGVDTIFFTGDLTNSGSKVEFDCLESDFLIPLLDALDLSFSDLFFSAGNHDVSRSSIDKVYLSYRARASSDELYDTSKEVNEYALEWKRLSNFNDFKNRVYKNIENLLNDGFLVDSREKNGIVIHSVNSAWLAQDDFDRGNLRIYNQLQYCLKKNGRNKTNVVLFHHPTDWLHLDEIHAVSREIEKSVDAVFFGHMHEFDQSVTINFSQDITLRLQAGTLDLRNRNSGYSIINLDKKSKFNYGRIFYRKYDNDSEEFFEWTDRAENGVCDFSIDKTQLFDSQKFSELSRWLKEKTQYDHIINIGKIESERKMISDIFIEPKFTNSTIELTDDYLNNIDCVQYIKDNNGFFIVSGSEQDGKTFLLKKIYIDQLDFQSAGDFRNMVFYMDVKDCNFDKKSKVMMSLISDYLDHDLLTSFEAKVKSSITSGSARILLDNIDKAEGRSLSSLMDFIRCYSDNTFIVTCKNDNAQEIVKSITEFYAGKIYNSSIGIMARSDIRKIISLRPNLFKFSTEDEIFENIIKVINSSHLPHNHFVYSILLAIYEDKKDLSEILNEADIIENYIEILLEKHCMDVPVNKPQYKTLIHFMGFLASKMLMYKKTYLDEQEYSRFALQFNEMTFNRFAIADYFKPLVDSGIVIKLKNECLEFSHVSFFYYFISYYMDIDEHTHATVFLNDNYLHLEKVVEYYASKNASKYDVLTFLEERVSALRAKLTKDILADQSVDVEVMDLNDLSNISILDIASTHKEFEERISEYKYDKEKIDCSNDEFMPLENKRIGDDGVSRLGGDFEFDMDGLELSLRYKKELSLLSKVFRSTELLMDRDRVLKFFNNILSNYIFLIKVDITRLDEDLIIPILLPRIESEFLNSDLSEEDRSQVIKGFRLFLSVMRATIPNAIEKMMSESLATRKPRFRNILEHKLNYITSSSEELLVRFLLLEIGKKDMKSNIEELENKNEKFINNAIFLKIAEIYLTENNLRKEDRVWLQSKIVKLLKNNKEIGQIGLDQFKNLLEGKKIDFSKN